MNQQLYNFPSSAWQARSNSRENRWLFDSELRLGRMAEVSGSKGAKNADESINQKVNHCIQAMKGRK